MVATTNKDQIIRQIDRLSPEQQKRVLEFAASLTSASPRQPPLGTPSEVLLKFVGRIPPDDLELIEKAIEDCEKIDLYEW